MLERLTDTQIARDISRIPECAGMAADCALTRRAMLRLGLLGATAGAVLPRMGWGESLPIPQVERPGMARMMMNENPLGPSPKAVEAIVKCAGEVHRYEGLTGGPLPPHLNFLVRQSGAQVIITAGSAQFLSMLGNWIAPGQLVQPWPTFSLLGEVTQICGGSVKNVPLAPDYSVDVDALLAAVSAETKAVYLCNPNNPTGLMMPYEQVKRIAESLPETCHLILDEAYYEYAADDQAGYGKLLHDDKLAARLVIVRTFSKIYALAAMRVGFAYTPTTLSGYFVRRLPMYPVNRAGYAAAAAAFADTEHLRKCRDFAKIEREKMTARLQKLGCKVVPSSATFLLVDTGRKSAQFVTILARKGYFVRPGSDYGYDKMMRVSLGTARQNEGFLKAVEEAMKA